MISFTFKSSKNQQCTACTGLRTRLDLRYEGARLFSAGSDSMVSHEFVSVTAPEVLESTALGGGARSSVSASKLWCSTMGKIPTGFFAPHRASPSMEPVCGKLRVMFDEVMAEPMPDQLASLADLLEQALERGDLSGAKHKKSKF